MASLLAQIEQSPQELAKVREGREEKVVKSVEEDKKGSVAAVMTIAEQLLKSELLEDFKAASPKASHSSVVSADHKAEETLLSKDESFKREAYLNKESRQLKSAHPEIKEDEKKSPCITANEKLQVSLEEIEEKNKALKEVVDLTNKENEKLLNQVELQLKTAKLEVKRLKAIGDYKERELTNVKDDIEKKERQLKDLGDELDYAGMENKYLLYHIDLLEDKLKDSKDSNEDLQFQVDEFKLMVKELKKTASWGSNQHDCGYLREEVELLKGSLDFSEHQEQLLKVQINGLKKDSSIRDEHEQIIRINNEVKDEQEKIIKQLKDQLATFERENSMMIAELQQLSNKDMQLNEIQNEKTRITADLEDQLAELKKENSRMTAELSDASEKYKQLSELQDEKVKITMELQNRLASLEKENARMVAELSKVSEKDKQLNELLKQVEGLKYQNTHLQDEKTRITDDFDDQLAELKEENSRMTAELSDASEKYKRLSELSDEKANITMDLQRQLASLEKENARMVAELSKVSEKDKQLNELLKQVKELKNQNTQHEALVAENQVADELTSSSEGSSKAKKIFKTKPKKRKSEIKRLKERVRQNEREIEQLSRFTRQRSFDTGDLRIWLAFLKDERTELDYVRNALKLQSARVQQLEDKEKELENVKKCFQQNENELVQMQDGLRLMAETAEAMKRCVREMDNFLQYADSNTCNPDISSIIDDRDRNDLNVSSNLDMCSLDENGHKGLTANSKEETGDKVVDIKTIAEDEHKGLTANSDKDSGHNPLTIITEHEELTVGSNEVGEHKEVTINSGEKIEHKRLTVTLEEEAGHEQMSMNSEEDNGHKELSVKLEEGSKPIKAQVAHVNEILDDSLEVIQCVKEALKQRQEGWQQKSGARDGELEHLRQCVKIQDGEIESLKQYVTKVEDEGVEFFGALNATIKELEEKLESSQNTLKKTEATFNQADDMLTSILACSGARDKDFDDSIDFIGKLNATIEKLQGKTEITQKLLKEKEASLKEVEAMLTALLTTSETRDFTQLQEKLQSTPILFKEKTEALMKAKAELQIKDSLLVAAEATHEDNIKQLEEKLKSSQIALKEKTAALEQVEARLRLPSASSEAKHKEFVKQVQEDLKSSQSSLQKPTEALEQTEAKLEMKSSLFSTAEAKHNELTDQLNNTITKLQSDLKMMQSSSKTDALKQAKEELQIRVGHLCAAEAKHEKLVGKLHDTIRELRSDLEGTQSLLNEKTDALEKADAQLQLKASLLASAEAKHDQLMENLYARERERSILKKQIDNAFGRCRI